MGLLEKCVILVEGKGRGITHGGLGGECAALGERFPQGESSIRTIARATRPTQDNVEGSKEVCLTVIKEEVSSDVECHPFERVQGEYSAQLKASSRELRSLLDCCAAPSNSESTKRTIAAATQRKN